MEQDDCEIEYLDEDEDIIQQFVQTAPIVEKKPTTRSRKVLKNADDKTSPVVKKKRSDVKRKLSTEDDSDYDPSEDLQQAVKKRMKSGLTVENAPVIPEKDTNDNTFPVVKKKRSNVKRKLSEDSDDDSSEELRHAMKTRRRSGPKVENAPILEKKRTTTRNVHEEDTDDNTSLLVKKKRSNVEGKLLSKDSDYDSSKEVRQTMKTRRRSGPKVENAPIVEKKTTTRNEPVEDTDDNTSLVKKKHSVAKRKLVSEVNLDYDPSEDLQQAMKKRKTTTKQLQPKILVLDKSDVLSLSSHSDDTTNRAKKVVAPKSELQERRKKGIRIPDFEDPLCLPVKAICKNADDVKKLKSWNKMCLEQFNKNFEPFRPSEDPVIVSRRTTVFRKVRNKASDQVHTTLWNKINVKDRNGKEKSEVHQIIVPLFREKIVLKPFTLAKNTPRVFSHKREVLLTKETNKNEEFLVAYNPGDAVTAVYKDVMQGDTLAEAEDNQQRLVIREATCNKICAPCYQTSWRGVRKREDTSIQCAICQRTFVSAYNLLTHLRAHHSDKEVRTHKAVLARALANAVDYHYKCRICQETFLSIKLLRQHVAKHQGKKSFHCEIGNHVAK